MNTLVEPSVRVAHLLANPAELALFVATAEKNADDWLTLNHRYADQTATVQSQAAAIDRLRAALIKMITRAALTPQPTKE